MERHPSSTWPRVLRDLNCCLAAITLLFCLLAGTAHAQKVNGAIVGTVLDPSGAAVSGAKVTITDVNTQVTQVLETNASGNYNAPDLPPGTYKVSVSEANFATSERTGISLFVDSTQRVDVTLSTGTVTQTVDVTSNTLPVLQTETADTGRKLDAAPVSQLPLANGRNFQGLLNTVPGAGVAVKQHSTFFNHPQGSMSSTINGNSSMYNDFSIEGIDDNQRTNLLQIYIPPIESIQEVDVTTSNYDPEQGSALGAVTNVILKSGGSKFHGEAYEFYTGNALDARTYFQRNATTYVPFTFPHIVDNYFGANISGPIPHTKTFFFFSYLQHQQRTGRNYVVNVPTAAFRNGDFSDLLNNSNASLKTIIYDPATGDTQDCLPGGNAKLCGTGRTPFANNIIPASRISKVAQNLLAYVPQPNTTGTNLYTSNFQLNSPFSQSLPDYDVKIDHFFPNNDHLSGRFSYEKPVLNQPGLFGIVGGPLSGGGVGGAEGNSSDSTYSIGANYNHIFSPNLISESRFGVARFLNIAFPTGYGQSLSSMAGIPGANISDFTSGIVTVSGEGFSDPMIGGCSNCPSTRAGTIIQAVENMTWVKGNHTFEFGGDYHRVRDDLRLVSNPSGAFAFTAGPTSLNGGPSGNLGNQFASFLLSQPGTVSRGLVNVFPAYRQNQTFAYFGDKWTATPQLTLTAGLRWEYYAPPTPHQTGGFSNYNPTTNNLELAGVGSIPRNLGMNKIFTNFGPRLGIAYRATPKTVIRSGFGMSYMTFPIDLYAYNYPIEPSASYNSLSSFGTAILSDSTAGSFEKGFPTPTAYVAPASGIIPANGALLSQSYYAINLKWRNPYLISYNLAVQQQLPGNWNVDVAYVGNVGVHTPIESNINASDTYGAAALGQPEYRAFNRTATTTEFFTGYRSAYNGLQVKVDHTFSRGFSLTNSYTFSRSLGYASESSDYVNGLLDYVNQRRNWALTDFNQTHVFNESFLWHLPVGKGSRLLNTGAPGFLLGGWQISGVWEFATGFPLNFSSTNTAAFNTPGSQLFPNQTGAFTKLKGLGTALWFDKSQFTNPAAGTQGNVGNYVYSGPAYFDLDASIARTFSIREKAHFEFRSEWLNATNTPQFAQPGTQLGSSSFGFVTSTIGNARIINLAGKITF